jgi:hypothetical protein
VIIRENEPTSIVAFTLSSKTYRDKMRNVASQTTGRKVEAFMPEDGANVADRSSVWDIVSLDEAIETDDPSRREGGTHLKYGAWRRFRAPLKLLSPADPRPRLRVRVINYLLPDLLR